MGGAEFGAILLAFDGDAHDLGFLFELLLELFLSAFLEFQFFVFGFFLVAFVDGLVGDVVHDLPAVVGDLGHESALLGVFLLDLHLETLQVPFLLGDLVVDLVEELARHRPLLGGDQLLFPDTAQLLGPLRGGHEAISGLFARGALRDLVLR